jgi:tetratricopeptide (TPR) repeat protein
MANKQRKEKETLEMQEKLQKCKEMIAPTLTSPETKKELANAWDVQSKVYKFTFSPLLDQVIAKQPTDTLALFENLVGALDAMEECFKVENASGKEPVYSKLNEIDVEHFRPYLGLCAQLFSHNNQWSKALESFTIWMDYCQRYTILAENAANLIADPDTPKMAFFTCLCAYHTKDYTTYDKYISQAKLYEEDIDQVNILHLSVLKMRGDTVGWISELREQSLANPSKEEPIEQLLAYYFNNNHQDEASVFADELLQKDSLNKIANYAKGVVLMNSKKYADAIPFFDKTIEIDDMYFQAYVNAGLCYNNWGRDLLDKLNEKKMTQKQYDAAVIPIREYFRKAEPYFLKVKELKPDQVDIWAAPLSQVYYMLQNKAKQAEMDKLLGY